MVEVEIEAETVVSFVIQKLLPWIVKEAKLLGSARKEVESITGELESILPFLKNADARAVREELEGNSINEGVRIWVEQVREEAYRIEDVIDEFTLTLARLPHHKRGLVGVFHRIYRLVEKLRLRRRIVVDIQDIRLSLAEIDERRKRFGFTSSGQALTSSMVFTKQGDRSHRLDAYYLEPDQIVGNESTRKWLKCWMVNGRPQRRVVTLVGAGGLGKTTLAANVYRNKEVRSHFDCYAWIIVKKAYRREDVLRKLLHKFAPGDIATWDQMELIDMLRGYLREKSYMVVFDNVWKDDFWGDVEHALVDNNKSSRIIITTRKKNVADSIPVSLADVCVLKPLPSDEEWQLFCRKAFDSDGLCPPELEVLSREILKKCGGLPLAISAVAGLLSKKTKVYAEWLKLLENLGSELGSDPNLNSCNRVLSEGYYDLPHYLKPCLLYFALFPEGYSVSCEKLIRLWMAEGFVHLQHDNERPEEVAEAYLKDLIDRNLVQVSETFVISGTAKTCRVHDLMRQIILRKTNQLGFGRVLNEHDMSQSRTIRRIALRNNANHVLANINNSKVRSFLVFDVDELPSKFMSILFVPNFKLIKVLDFEDAPLDTLHEDVGNLFLLHYLSLKNTKVKTLPKSIGMLLNLETLDLTQTLVTTLPIEIKNLEKLRYLLVCKDDYDDFAYGRTIIQEGFGLLTNLQELYFVEASSRVVKECWNLRQLRRLGIRLTDGNGKHLFGSISNMQNLRILTVESRNREEILDMQLMVSPPLHLQCLYLIGNLKKLPHWISHLQNLAKIYLAWSGFTDDPMIVFHALPNLLELNLHGAYDGEQLHVKQGWFLKLQFLFLRSFEGLKFMTIEDGAMPLLISLVIEKCPLLWEIPTGIEHLRNLKCLNFTNMFEQITSGMITHDNWEKLRHIPNVNVSYAEEGKYIKRPVKDILDV